MRVSSLLNEYFEKSPPKRGRLFETSLDLPVSVQRKPWTRSEDGKGRTYDFSSREDLKDFVQTILDFDDESGSGLIVSVESAKVSVQLNQGEGYRPVERIMQILDSIYNEITGK